MSVTLQPLSEVHLGSNGILFDVFNYNKNDIEYISTLSIVGFFVVLIAAFNFMNLSTSYSVNRAKEVGLRKVMGAIRKQLAIQFLMESVIICFLSLFIALALLSIVSVYINFGISENLLLHLLQHRMMVWITAGTLIVGLLAGLYPVAVLSGFGIIKILKGNFKTSSSGVFLRKSLVVIQFTASIVMIIGTLVVYHQLDYLKHTNTGFKADQIITLNLGDQELRSRGETLRNQLSDIPSVLSTAYSSSMPGRQTGRTGMQPEGVADDDVWIVSQAYIDDDFISLMGMEIGMGRNYSNQFGTEEQDLIINEAAAKALNWDEPVGKKISFGPNNQHTVVGIVKDFNFANMRHKIEPLVLQYSPDPLGVLSLKISGEEVSTSIKKIENAWSKVNPDYPFEYSFFDEEYGRQYENDQRFATLVVSFTWLAIFIACLGLFGLSIFTAQQRIKEIGVRKVMGASVFSIVALLAKEFTKPVLIACTVAIPGAWYFMNQWLEQFAYRIDMPWVSFSLACLAALLIAQLTVSFQSIKAAISNPIDALRYE